MSKHTPGPWVANRYEDGELFVSADGLRVCIVTKCVSMESMIDRAEAEANARLIAAAPNLLAALRGMVESYELEASAENPALLAARAAIAKATGSAA